MSGFNKIKSEVFSSSNNGGLLKHTCVVRVLEKIKCTANEKRDIVQLYLIVNCEKCTRFWGRGKPGVIKGYFPEHVDNTRT